MKTNKKHQIPSIEGFITASTEQIAKASINQAPDSPLISRKHQEEKLALEVNGCLHEHFNKIERGGGHIFTKLVELSLNEPYLLSEKIFQDIVNFGIQANDNFDDIDGYYAKIADNKSLKEIFQLSNETIGAFYKAAAEIYREKRYQDASDAFSILVILDPDVYLFWFGLANCEYFCNHFDQALIAYDMAIQLKPSEPLNYIFSANCYEEIHDYSKALLSLEEAISIIDLDKEKYNDVSQKIVEQKKRIENKLK